MEPNNKKPTTEEKFYLTVEDGDIIGQDEPFISITEFKNNKWVGGRILYWFDLDDINDNNFTLSSDKLPTEKKFYIVIIEDEDEIYRTISMFNDPGWSFEDNVIAWMEYPEIPKDLIKKKETLDRLQLIVTISDQLDKDTIVLSDKLKGKVNEPLTVTRYPIISHMNIIQIQNVNYANFKNENTAIISEDLAVNIGAEFQYDMICIIPIDTSKNHWN